MPRPPIAVNVELISKSTVNAPFLTLIASFPEAPGVLSVVWSMCIFALPLIDKLPSAFTTEKSVSVRLPRPLIRLLEPIEINDGFIPLKFNAGLVGFPTILKLSNTTVVFPNTSMETPLNVREFPENFTILTSLAIEISIFAFAVTFAKSTNT